MTATDTAEESCGRLIIARSAPGKVELLAGWNFGIILHCRTFLHEWRFVRGLATGARQAADSHVAFINRTVRAGALATSEEW